MAAWHPVHQSIDFDRRLETAGKPYDPPLLPYEIALIEALGCSEEEYKTFVRYAAQQAYIRPAEYEHIPEVYAVAPLAAAGYLAATSAAAAKSATTIILTNLAIGIALTAASLLLAPKPPAISDKRIKQRELRDQIGPTRFNQTSSFDNIASLAEYGQAIPIPFGRYDSTTGTGGLTLAPALVWSRVYSYGTYRAFEGIYVVGQYGLAQPPEIAGVRLGTFALNNLNTDEYALFWSSNPGSNNPTSERVLIGGSQGDRHKGTSGRKSPFTAPSITVDVDDAASMAYSPQSQVQFGTATPIANGTAYRYNWEIISAPSVSFEGEGGEDAKKETRARRKKIAGADADQVGGEPTGKSGQPGIGRAYSRTMGLTHHVTSSAFANYDNKTTVNVSKGDILKFTVFRQNYENLNDNFTYNGYKTQVNVKDLRDTAREWREQSSDLLSVGSEWLIGATVWRVVKNAGIDNVVSRLVIDLECVEILGDNRVGIAGERAVSNPLAGYEGQQFDETIHCDINHWPLCRYFSFTIRPVRRDTRVIEFGIRSQVWNRADGLCNFSVIPTPAKLDRLDRKDVTLTTPRQSRYFKRASFFQIAVRPVPTSTQTSDWSVIPQLFCVVGRSPIDLHNYIRIKASDSAYYEYKFIPKTGADIYHNYSNSRAWRLKADEAQLLDWTPHNTDYGVFYVQTNGLELTVAELLNSPQMLTDKSDVGNAPNVLPTIITPSAVSITRTRVDKGDNKDTVDAWLTSVLGLATNENLRGTTQRHTFTIAKPGTPAETMQLRVTATSVKNPEKPKDSIRRWTWQDISFRINSYVGTWALGTEGEITVTGLSWLTNPFAAKHRYTAVTLVISVAQVQEIVQRAQDADVSTAERSFEIGTGVADCSYFSEITKSNDSNPEHESVYVNEYVENETTPQYTGMSVTALSLKSSGQINSVDQMRMWVPDGIAVRRLLDDTTGPSNLFTDAVLYLLENPDQGLGNTIPAPLIDETSLAVTGRFLQANGIFFDSVIEEPENLRSFLYDAASLQLCNFTIKNGRFGMMPALPYDANGKISTAPINIEQIFTAGNIIEGSLQVNYLDAAQRLNLQALVTWRESLKYDLPSQRSAVVSWSDTAGNTQNQQSYDLSEFCTNRDQAILTAKFLLSTRRKITHSIAFKTVPDGLDIEPGSYIRVITTSTTYSAQNNGVITDAGTLVSVDSIADGEYKALVYKPQTGEIVEKQITIASDAVTDAEVYGCLFTLLSTKVNQAVYQVEQLTIEEDGLVSVAAIHVPVTDTGASVVADDVLNGLFEVEE
jgi:hypothetical protein